MGFISNAYNDLATQRIAPAARERSGIANRREETARRRRRRGEEDKDSFEAAVDTFESTQQETSED